MNSSKKLPFEKKDIHYDPTRGEVSLKREKFDELIRFVQALLQESQQAEDDRDTARSRQRRASDAVDVLTEYAGMVERANRSVQRWLQHNTIQELSRRSRIPYATCHRIVRERMQNSQIKVETMQKILRVVEAPPAAEANET